MEERRSDHLIARLPERNPDFSFPKGRKRKKSFRIMGELLEIEGARRPKRDTHDMANETRRAIGSDCNHQVEIISSVMERAERVQAKLKAQYPSFVKPMIRSNIAGGFWLISFEISLMYMSKLVSIKICWMSFKIIYLEAPPDTYEFRDMGKTYVPMWWSLPKLFCELHLPSHDISITLVDESHKEYYTKYLPVRRGLSAGWKGFSISHNLEEGDVLVFHLVGAWKMKVYIVRANHFGEADAAVGLLQLQAQAEAVDHEHVRRRVGIFRYLDKCS